MTNKEKAVKLALERYPERLTPDREFDLYENDRRIFMQGALEMSEWKDQQFKEYLEKKLGNYAGGELVYAGVFINDIINELFGGDEFVK